jgi:hypothetical protein
VLEPWIGHFLRRRDPTVDAIRARHVTFGIAAFTAFVTFYTFAGQPTKNRLEWMLANRPELASLVSRWHEPRLGERRLLALVRGSRMKRLLRRMLDTNEFLCDFGVRSRIMLDLLMRLCRVQDICEEVDTLILEHTCQCM